MNLRILLSYHYYKTTDLDKMFSQHFTPPYPEVFSDSGGFSAMTQGAVIDIQEYAAWTKRFAHLITTVANLDVVGDASATLDNQHRLEDLGVNAIPVFHVGEDWSYLERYVEKYPYIALGGMVPHMRFAKRLMPWIIRCFKIAGDKAVFHGFGATSWEVIKNLRWYSVDSSSWGQGFRFGQVPLFDDIQGRFFDVNLGDYKQANKHSLLIQKLGFSPLDFADRARNDLAKICAISALSYMKAEQWLRRRHGEVSIPTKTDHPTGLRLHLADSNYANLSSADKGLKRYLSDAQHEAGDIIRAKGVLDELRD